MSSCSNGARYCNCNTTEYFVCGHSWSTEEESVTLPLTFHLIFLVFSKIVCQLLDQMVWNVNVVQIHGAQMMNPVDFLGFHLAPRVFTYTKKYLTISLCMDGLAQSLVQTVIVPRWWMQMIVVTFPLAPNVDISVFWLNACRANGCPTTPLSVAIPCCESVVKMHIITTWHGAAKVD